MSQDLERFDDVARSLGFEPVGEWSEERSEQRVDPDSELGRAMAAAGPPGRTYRGYSDADAGDGTGPAIVVVEDPDGPDRPLEHRLRHSPTGFSWGYPGSGPADLARSILWDHLGREPEPGLYQRFKRAFIAPLPIGAGWTITAAAIAAWLASHGERDA